jgi:hypothetical protein
VVRPADIEGRFTAASLLSEFAPLRGNLPNCRPRQVALQKGGTLSWATPLTLRTYSQRCRAPSLEPTLQQKFVVELENLKIPPAQLRKLFQHLALERRLDVVEHDGKVQRMLELIELCRQRSRRQVL